LRMLRITLLTLFVIIFTASCSKSCHFMGGGEEEKTPPSTNITKKIYQPQRQQEEINLEKYLVYPWDLLEDQEFKKLYLKSLGDLKNIFWIRKIHAPADRNHIVDLRGKKYVFISFCKPHDCADNFVAILYDPYDEELFGYYYSEGRKIPIGLMNREKDRLLRVALKRIGLDRDAEKIAKAKLTEPSKVIKKKLDECPTIDKKVVLKSLKQYEENENIYRLVLKALEQSEELPKELLNEIKIDDVYIAYLDVNDDGKKDILFSVQSPLFCGNIGCGMYLLLNKGNGDYRPLYLGISVDDTIYITNQKHKGFRVLIKNQHQKLIYDGKGYKLGGECYVN